MLTDPTALTISTINAINISNINAKISIRNIYTYLLSIIHLVNLAKRKEPLLALNPLNTHYRHFLQVYLNN